MTRCMHTHFAASFERDKPFMHACVCMWFCFSPGLKCFVSTSSWAHPKHAQTSNPPTIIIISASKVAAQFLGPLGSVRNFANAHQSNRLFFRQSSSSALGVLCCIVWFISFYFYLLLLYTADRWWFNGWFGAKVVSFVCRNLAENRFVLCGS